MKSPGSDRLLVAGGMLCLLLAGTLALRPGADRPADPPRPPWGPGPAPAFVAVVFRLADCGGSIDRLTAWNAVHRGGRVPVLGFVLDGPADPAGIRKSLEGSGIEFPLRHGNGRYFTHLLGTVGAARTPAAVVVDPHGRVRMVLPLDDRLRPDDVQKVLAAAEIGGGAGGGE